jgi:hypothetical protein
MVQTNRQAHWENVYTSRGESEVSWFQENPAPSLEHLSPRPLPRSARRDNKGADGAASVKMKSRGWAPAFFGAIRRSFLCLIEARFDFEGPLRGGRSVQALCCIDRYWYEAHHPDWSVDVP